jgi:hypothetical protein
MPQMGDGDYADDSYAILPLNLQHQLLLDPPPATPPFDSPSFRPSFPSTPTGSGPHLDERTSPDWSSIRFPRLETPSPANRTMAHVPLTPGSQEVFDTYINGTPPV